MGPCQHGLGKLVISDARARQEFVLRDDVIVPRPMVKGQLEQPLFVWNKTHSVDTASCALDQLL